MSANPRPEAMGAVVQASVAAGAMPEPAVASNEPLAPPVERRSMQRTGPFGESGPARSLFSEILDWMLAPLLLVWPMSVGFTFLVAQGLSNGPFDRALGDSVLAVADQVRETEKGMRLSLPPAARDILRSDELDVITYQVIGHEGELLGGDRDMPVPLAYEVIAPGAVRFRDDRVRGIDVRVAYLWLEGALTGNQRPVLIQVAETLEKRTRLANEIIKGVILPQFVVLPIAVLLVWFGLTRGIAPVEALSAKLRARKENDFSPINLRDAPEEMHVLVRSFNELLERLEKNVAAQRRFVADAAHQLKTPLAGLRMQAELALRESSREEIERSLKQIARGSQQATRLANQLLSLARAENHALLILPLTPVDLVGIARQMTTDWVPAALAAGHDLGFEAFENTLQCKGNATLLGEMLKNLLDNAIRYTPSGGRITVRVFGGEPISLEVEDTGPGVAPAQRERVFEPFYRVPEAGSEGTGLGLAIVREIARQHGASVTLHAADPHGLIVRVVFPAAEATTEAV
jgi:two-component system, OmpR family, sensor histidine kinase TctE